MEYQLGLVAFSFFLCNSVLLIYGFARSNSRFISRKEGL